MHVMHFRHQLAGITPGSFHCGIMLILQSDQLAWLLHLLPYELQGVTEVASSLMRGDYVSVDTVPEDDRPSHESITQEYMLVPAQMLMVQLMSLIRAHMMAEPNSYKVGSLFGVCADCRFPCMRVNSRCSITQIYFLSAV